MASEEESPPPQQAVMVNEPEAKVEQIQPENNIGDEAQIKVEEIQAEDKIGDAAQAKVEEIDDKVPVKVEDKTVNDDQVEQTQQEDKIEVTQEKVEQSGAVKNEEKVEEMQQENETEETIQKVMDLEQAPSIIEDASDIEKHGKFMKEEQEISEAVITEVLEMQPQYIEIEGEEFQTAVFNLGDQFPYTSSDGLIPPPPTPILTAESSHLDMEFSEHQSKVEIEDEAKELSTTEIEIRQGGESIKTSQKPKTKKGKQTGFKTASINETPTVYGGSDTDLEKMVIARERNREREKQIAECNRYAGVEKFASNFVDNIIDKSITNIEENRMMYIQRESTTLGEEEVSTLSSFRTFMEVFGTSTKWPRIQEFSKEIGETVIGEFVQTWEYEEDWMFCIDFLLEQSDECSEFYLYEVKWSIPSKPYPIPQATASVYFTIEVSRIKPLFCPVDVTYVFEGSRTVHTPGKIRFQEHWLFSIIDAKLEMYKHIKF